MLHVCITEGEMAMKAGLHVLYMYALHAVGISC